MTDTIPAMSNIVPPVSLKENALAAVKEAVITQRLKPGNLYSESGLAEELGVSRTPVREALIALSTQGFIGFERGKGFRIKEPTEKAIRDIYGLRMVLEIGAINIIVPLIDDKARNRLDEIHRADLSASRVKDVRGFQLVDRKFHLSLGRLTGNPYFVFALEGIRDLVEWMTFLPLFREARFKEAMEEHKAVIERLKDRDAPGAVRKMEEHLRIGEKRAVEAVSTSKDPGL